MAGIRSESKGFSAAVIAIMPQTPSTHGWSVLSNAILRAWAELSGGTGHVMALVTSCLIFSDGMLPGLLG